MFQPTAPVAHCHLLPVDDQWAARHRAVHRKTVGRQRPDCWASNCHLSPARRLTPLARPPGYRLRAIAPECWGSVGGIRQTARRTAHHCPIAAGPDAIRPASNDSSHRVHSTTLFANATCLLPVAAPHCPLRSAVHVNPNGQTQACPGFVRAEPLVCSPPID